MAGNLQATGCKKATLVRLVLVAAEFLRRVLDKLPDKVPAVLTDNGVQFTPQPHQFLPGGHSFDRICREYGVEHRLTKPAHPWTNGQVERMNRTLKEAPVKRFHYQTTEELNEHLQVFLLAYHHAKRLKTLRGLTPHEFVGAQWQKNPPIFTQDPTHLTLGLYILTTPMVSSCWRSQPSGFWDEGVIRCI